MGAIGASPDSRTDSEYLGRYGGVQQIQSQYCDLQVDEYLCPDVKICFSVSDEQ